VGILAKIVAHYDQQGGTCVNHTYPLVNIRNFLLRVILQITFIVVGYNVWCPMSHDKPRN